MLIIETQGDMTTKEEVAGETEPKVTDCMIQGIETTAWKDLIDQRDDNLLTSIQDLLTTS